MNAVRDGRGRGKEFGVDDVAVQRADPRVLFVAFLRESVAVFFGQFLRLELPIQFGLAGLSFLTLGLHRRQFVRMRFFDPGTLGLLCFGLGKVVDVDVAPDTALGLVDRGAVMKEPADCVVVAL